MLKSEDMIKIDDSLKEVADKMAIDEKQIVQNISRRWTNQVRRGQSKDFNESILVPGEMAALLDKHTIVFCFGEGDCKYLNFDENVTEETARELIDKISVFHKLYFESRMKK